MLRARNLFLAWLAYGALQLALLGVPGAAAQPRVGAGGARIHSESQSVSLGKRALAPEASHRRTPTTPFAPSAHTRLDLPTPGGREAIVLPHRQADTDGATVLPPARAPPALS